MKRLLCAGTGIRTASLNSLGGGFEMELNIESNVFFTASGSREAGDTLFDWLVCCSAKLEVPFYGQAVSALGLCWLHHIQILGLNINCKHDLDEQKIARDYVTL